jgi:hypothetical protein
MPSKSGAPFWDMGLADESDAAIGLFLIDTLARAEEAAS